MNEFKDIEVNIDSLNDKEIKIVDQQLLDVENEEKSIQLIKNYLILIVLNINE